MNIFGRGSHHQGDDAVKQEGHVVIKDAWVEVGGLRTHYVTGGDGPPLVLLHGHGESAASWRWVLPALARTHRVYAPDFPGAGESVKPAVYSQPPRSSPISSPPSWTRSASIA